MVGAFPVFKLGVLAVKQISRPIANRLKQKASYNGFFRRYLCIPSGQMYHLWDTRLKLKLLGLGSPAEVKKLSDESAAETGAEILVFLEYKRQSKNEAVKEEKAKAKLEELHDAIEGLELRVAAQSETLYLLSKRLEQQKK